ncbi:hypothetical protein M422DRAFT_85393, partial [Sphaerobolus stellatus SS14]
SIQGWSVCITFNIYELGTSFSILIILGEAPENPEDWCIEAANRMAGSCANCQNQVNLIDEGFVHLNEGIAELSGLGSFKPYIIHPSLQKKLHWCVQKTGGSPAELESLEVTVVATPLSLPPGSHFPI